MVAIKAWTDEEFQRAIVLKGQGQTTAQIGVALNRTESSIRSKLRKRNQPSGIPVPQQAVENMRVASLETTIQQQQTKLDSYQSAAGVVPEWISDYDVKEEWARAAAINSKKIEKAKTEGLFSKSFGHEPIGIVAVSDQHISIGAAVDLYKMQADAELIRDTPGFFCVLAGDGVDNHIKFKSAALESRSAPSEQWLFYNYYLSILAEKTLVMINGNHDTWTRQFSGVDIVSMLAEKNKICHAPDEARLTLNVGGQEYKIAVRHTYKYHSSINQTHSVKRWYDMGPSTFDIGIMGDKHEAALEEFSRHSQLRWACRPGSYQITSDFGRQHGYTNSIPTSPTFILWPGERKIVAYGSVQKAAECWDQIRSGVLN